MNERLLRWILILALVLPVKPPVASAAGLLADLTVMMLDAVDPVTAGDTATYTLTVTNLGPAQAVNVTLTATLAAGTTFASITPSAGCATSAGGAICTLATLDSGASSVYTLTADVSPATRGILVSSATVSSVLDDPDGNNNSAAVTTSVEANVDLKLMSSGASPDPAVAGAALTFTYTVENLGRSLATDVVFTDTLPTGAMAGYLSATPGYTCSGSTIAVTCQIGSLAPAGVSGPGWIDSGAVITVAVTPRADLAAGATLFNVATLDAFELEASAADNTVFTSVPVTRSSDLALLMAGPTGPLKTTEALTYTLTVTNTGPSVDTGVSIEGTYPDLIWTDPIVSDPACLLTHGVLSCPLGALAVGEARAITITTTALSNQVLPVDFQATVDGINSEPAGALLDNQSLVSAAIEPFMIYFAWLARD